MYCNPRILENKHVDFPVYVVGLLQDSCMSGCTVLLVNYTEADSDLSNGGNHSSTGTVVTKRSGVANDESQCEDLAREGLAMYPPEYSMGDVCVVYLSQTSFFDEPCSNGTVLIAFDNLSPSLFVERLAPATDSYTHTDNFIYGCDNYSQYEDPNLFMRDQCFATRCSACMKSTSELRKA